MELKVILGLLVSALEDGEVILVLYKQICVVIMVSILLERWVGVSVILVGLVMIVPRIIPVAGMEHGTVHPVPVNPAGAAAIVPRIIPAAGMEVGLS